MAYMHQVDTATMVTRRPIHDWRDTGRDELRRLAAARQTAANKLNEECRNADVWVSGNMANARPSSDDSPAAIATTAGRQ